MLARAGLLQNSIVDHARYGGAPPSPEVIDGSVKNSLL
jgi:hypothetical protein